jgi:hypothetical protein
MVYKYYYYNLKFSKGKLYHHSDTNGWYANMASIKVVSEGIN